MKDEVIYNLKEETKKGFFKVLFGRSVLLSVFLIFQILILFSFFTKYLVISISGEILLRFIMIIYLLNVDKVNDVKITWIIIIMILPLFGTFFYWYVYFDPIHRLINKNIMKIEEKTKKILKSDKIFIEDRYFKNISNYLENNGFRTYCNNKIKYYSLGEEMFQDMLLELEKAEKYIFLEYFIIDKGYMWDKILEILKRKASSNVEVRIMYDGTCAFKLLPYNYPFELKKYNIKAKMFSPVRPFLSTHYNNRDHRKIMIIDGKVAFNGGINIADEYINKINRFGHWKDTGLKIEGNVVSQFLLMFLQLWNIKEFNEDISKYIYKFEDANTDNYAIAFSDSPYDKELLSENIYIDMINTAKEYVYITTPYFIIDSHLLNSLLLAAKKGIDVRIILPYIADNKIASLLAKSYYKKLLINGVKIYEYIPGFIHSKMFLSDDIKAIVGTVNLDYRSLYHHFECGTYLYNDKEIFNIKKDILNTLDMSKQISMHDVKKRNKIIVFLSMIVNIFSPLI